MNRPDIDYILDSEDNKTNLLYLLGYVWGMGAQDAPIDTEHLVELADAMHKKYTEGNQCHLKKVK